MKTYSEDELKEKAKAVFGQYPKIKTLLVTSDGQCFDAINSQSADYHCKYNALKKQLTITTFHRAGLEKEEQQESITEFELTDDLKTENVEQKEETETVEESKSTVLEKTEEMETVQKSEDSLTEESTVLEKTEEIETTEDLEPIKEALPVLPLKKNNPKTKKS